MLNPKEKFFEGEKREGFFIDSRMKRYWASQIEVLEEIKRICDKYKINILPNGVRFWEQCVIKVLFRGMMISI